MIAAARSRAARAASTAAASASRRRRHASSAASASASSAASASGAPAVRVGRDPTFRSYARRQAASDMRVTVFGATGNVGITLVDALCTRGAQVVLPFRGDGMDARRLKVTGDLGQVVHMPIETRNAASIERAVEGSDVVVNLIGSNFEPFPAAYGGRLAQAAMRHASSLTFEEVHGTLARDIARYAKRAGARRLIHMSALNAHLESPSRFLATKALGELHVMREFPEATVLRPAPVFGHEDFFINRFARMCWGKWPRAVDARTRRKVQPVYVADVAAAVCNAIEMRETHGRAYDLGGRETLEFVELVRAIEKATNRPLVGLWTNQGTALALEMAEELLLPRQLMLQSRDMLIRDQLDATVSEHARGIRDLGVEPDGLSDHFEALVYKWVEETYTDHSFME